MDFFPDIDVSALQAEAIARGLYAIASVDGVHERELALISEFHSAAASGDTGDGSPLEASVSSFGLPVPWSSMPPGASSLRLPRRTTKVCSL